MQRCCKRITKHKFILFHAKNESHRKISRIFVNQLKEINFSQGIEEEDVSPGFVLCDASNPIRTGKVFDAQVVILEHKSIICAGYSAVMHIHCAAEEITVKVSQTLFLHFTMKFKFFFFSNFNTKTLTFILPDSYLFSR